MKVLVDADSPVYRIAAVHQEEAHFPLGDDDAGELYSHVATDLEGAQKALDAWAEDLAWEFGVQLEDLIMCLSGKREDCFRRKLLPTYKSNRDGKKDPVLREPLNQYLIAEYTVERHPQLEADDLLGVLSQDWDDVLMVSIDKDLDQIVGEHYNPQKELYYSISEQQADYQFYTQTLTGDSTDGYKGCPRIGPVTASELLQDDLTPEETWSVIVDTYMAKDLTAEDALTQARIARILRPGEYDSGKGRIKLWKPPTTP